MSNFISMMPGHRHMRSFSEAVNYDPATAIFIGLSVFKAANEMKNAKSAAKATVAEGEIVARNKAQEVMRKTASQKVSFLNSGLTLEGTPMNVIESTFNTGLEDINQISGNYNTKAKNQINAGRSAAIESLGSGFSNAAMPGMGNVGGDMAAGFGSMSQGAGFGTGYDLSQSMRNNPGLF